MGPPPRHGAAARRVMSARPAVADPLWVRLLLTGTALVFLALFLVVPLAAVFAQALEQGWRAYLAQRQQAVPVQA